MGQAGILGKPPCGYGEEKEPESQIKQTNLINIFIYIFKFLGSVIFRNVSRDSPLFLKDISCLGYIALRIF